MLEVVIRFPKAQFLKTKPHVQMNLQRIEPREVILFTINSQSFMKGATFKKKMELGREGY